MTVSTYTVPWVSLQHLTGADRSRLLTRHRDPLDIACMYDPGDPHNGMFMCVDVVDPGEYSDPPEGYSDGFQALWHWAQQQGYSWLRLVDWGDVVEGLPVFNKQKTS